MNPEVSAMRERIERNKDDDIKKRRSILKVIESDNTAQKTAATLSYIPANTKCVYCGVLLNDKNATIDHVIPLSRGGTDTAGNKVYACVTCNSSKADMLLSEWYAKQFGVNLKKSKKKIKSDDRFKAGVSPKKKIG